MRVVVIFVQIKNKYCTMFGDGKNCVADRDYIQRGGDIYNRYWRLGYSTMVGCMKRCYDHRR